MKNILATSRTPRRFAGLSASGLLLASLGFAALLWAVWTTQRLVELSRREVVTVQLSRLMGDFVDGEARAGRHPEETRARVEGYLKAIEASLEALGKDGRTVLVAEAVVAGGTRDLTKEVRADVARRLGGAARAAR